MTDSNDAAVLAHFQARLAVIDWHKDITALLAFLEESEAATLALIKYLRNPKHVPRPTASGDIEFGFVIYWVHYPPPEITALLARHPLLKLAFEALQLLAPATHITHDDYAQLEKDYAQYGEPGPDGTIYGFARYQQLDKFWMLAVLNYALNLIDHNEIVKFPNNPVATIALSRKHGNAGKDPVLGIVGDWGTGYYADENKGACPAQRVIQQITNTAQSPGIDYLIHLGDVYYAGTDAGRPLPGEERANFYELWPDQGPGRNFTLNSNHEMYGAGKGYFPIALQAHGKFAAQNGMSYCAMTYGPWLVLCLDSAYYSDAYNGLGMYMNGAIGTAAAAQQIAWVAGFRGHKGPVMVMTHHVGCDTLSTQITPLYQQVAGALGRPPSLWYWGHVHNGIVYDKMHDFGTKPVIAVPTKGRCCGHAAIPFGKAWGLETPDGKTQPNVLYYAHTPDPALPDTGGSNPANPRVRNGYALVTLHRDGGYTEAFYETGVMQPMFERRWRAGELG